MNGDEDQSITRQKGEESLTKFLSILRPFCGGEGGQNITTIIERNKNLEEEVNDLCAAQRTNLNLMKDQEADLKRIQATLEESLKMEKMRVAEALREAEDAKELRDQIKDSEKQIQGLIKAKKTVEVNHSAEVSKKNQLQDKVQQIGEEKKALLDKLQKQSVEHEKTVNKLESVKTSLSTVRNFLVPLEGLNETRKSTMFVFLYQPNTTRKIR